MLKYGILNAQVRSLLARIGHRDRFAITDAGYNNPVGVETVDLAFLPNIPTALQVLDGVSSEFSIEKVILAEEIKEMAPELLKEYQKRFSETPIEFIPHSEFDKLMPTMKGILRSGQYNLHAPNIILQAGCTYDNEK